MNPLFKMIFKRTKLFKRRCAKEFRESILTLALVEVSTLLGINDPKWKRYPVIMNEYSFLISCLDSVYFSVFALENLICLPGFLLSHSFFCVCGKASPLQGFMLIE